MCRARLLTVAATTGLVVGCGGNGVSTDQLEISLEDFGGSGFRCSEIGEHEFSCTGRVAGERERLTVVAQDLSSYTIHVRGD